MGKTDKRLYKLILCSIFAALAFASCYIHIPMPVGFIHLGNFVCVIASLLCGGLIGGISGSLGMGLYDWFVYYGGFTAGTIRTFLLKFLLGLIVGSVFRFILKKKLNTKLINLVLLMLFVIFFVITLILAINSPINISSKVLKVSFFVPIIIFVLILIFGLTIIFDYRLNKIQKASLCSISIGISFNIVGEIFIKAFLYYIFEGKYQTYKQGLIYSITGLPSIIITSVVTCILGTLIFYPLYSASSIHNRYDDIKEYIKD